MLSSCFVSSSVAIIFLVHPFTHRILSPLYIRSRSDVPLQATRTAELIHFTSLQPCPVAWSAQRWRVHHDVSQHGSPTHLRVQVPRQLAKQRSMAQNKTESANGREISVRDKARLKNQSSEAPSWNREPIVHSP